MTVQKAINHLLDEKMTNKVYMKATEKDENINKVSKKIVIDQCEMQIEALEMGIEALKFKEVMFEDKKIAKRVKKIFKKIEKKRLKAMKQLSKAAVHNKIIKAQMIKEQEARNE